MKMLISLLRNQSDAPGQPPSSEEEGRQAEGKYGQAIIVTKILILVTIGLLVRYGWLAMTRLCLVICLYLNGPILGVL